MDPLAKTGDIPSLFMNADDRSRIANRMIANGEAKDYHDAMTILSRKSVRARRRKRDAVQRQARRAARAADYRERNAYLYE